MKKFLVFLTTIVVAVTLGLTTYYFLRNDEVINFKTKEIYCNAGDVIELDKLGKVVKKEYSKTTYNYNAGGATVTALINFDEQKGYYTALAGGDTEIVISTSNKKFPQFKIAVHIGDGSAQFPYFVENEEDLTRMGDVYSLSAHYTLRNNIVLSENFKPIGYNASTSSWVGFNGKFFGNGNTISDLKLSSPDYVNAGLFYSLSNAKVENLILSNVNIEGNYAHVGALAGMATASQISNVKVVNSNLTTLANNAKMGGLVGAVNGNTSTVLMSAVEDVNLVLGSTSATASNGVIGGLVGELNLAKAQATYVRDVNVTINGSAVVGGHTGKFTISKDYGTIQQSYALATCGSSTFGAFIGEIAQSGNFDNTTNLKYLIGNYVVTNGKKVVNTYNSTFFASLEDASKSIYFICSFQTEALLLANTDYVFYAVNSNNKTMWDSSAWIFAFGQLPELRMTNTTLSSVSSEYLLRDLTVQDVGNKQDFINFINDCRNTDGKVLKKKFTLSSDIDLSNTNWLPIELEDSVIDGGNFKIKGLKLTTTTGGNVGLFSTIKNSTIKNLTLEDVQIDGTSNAASVGALAGEVISANETTASTISNVKVSYAGGVNISATNFGGLTAKVNKGTIITNNTVSNLAVASSANILNVGGLVAIAEQANISANEIKASTLFGKNTVGGLVAKSSSVLTNNFGAVNVKYSNNGYSALVGGVVAENNGIIKGGKVEISVEILQTNTNVKVGGVAAINNGTISAVELTGAGIANGNVQALALEIGGVAATNNGTIENAKCYIVSVGTFQAGKDHKVAGIAVSNSGRASKIIKTVVSADVSGNIVAGAVVEMSNASAVMDQVLVAKINTTTKALSENLIKGDKYVAGVVYNLASGKVSNVQAKSQVYGVANNTVSSLIVLLFPNEASFISATIDSSLNGFGKFYKETWTDYTGESVENNFNLYGVDAAAGSMQGVVINTTAANRYNKDYKTAFFLRNDYFWVYYVPTYENTDESSYFRDVTETEFRNAAIFKESIKVVAENTGVFTSGSTTFTKDSTFDFSNNIWVENNGIMLSFVASL